MAAVNALLIMLGLSLLLELGWFLTRRRARRHYGRRRVLPESEHGFRAPKPAWVREEIIRLKAQGPDLGCRPIAMIFNRRHAARGMSVGKTFVSTVIRRHTTRSRWHGARCGAGNSAPAPGTASGAWT